MEDKPSYSRAEVLKMLRAFNEAYEKRERIHGYIPPKKSEIEKRIEEERALGDNLASKIPAEILKKIFSMYPSANR